MLQVRLHLQGNTEINKNELNERDYNNGDTYTPSKENHMNLGTT